VLPDLGTLLDHHTVCQQLRWQQMLSERTSSSGRTRHTCGDSATSNCGTESLDEEDSSDGTWEEEEEEEESEVGARACGGCCLPCLRQ
jgi:hypothetical protein